MAKVWDWKIEIESRSMLHVPESTRFLSVQVKADKCAYLYGIVPDDPVPASAPRILRVVSAGEKFTATDLIYIGTVQIDWFVGHVFEQPAQGVPDVVDSRYHDDHKELRKSPV